MARCSLALFALAALVSLAAAGPLPQRARLAGKENGAKATSKKAHPVKKVVRRPIPLSVACQIAPGAPGQKIVNCKVTNLLRIPVCAHLRCSPGPAAQCTNSQGTGGDVRTTGPPPDCSWNVVNGCSSPGVVYPGGQWSFGFTTSYQGPIGVSLPPLSMALSPPFNGTQCAPQ